MVHLGDTASFLRVVRIYVKKDELSLRIRESLETWEFDLLKAGRETGGRQQIGD